MTGKELAVLADRYLANDLDFVTFLRSIPYLPDNTLTWDLHDLVEHMPRIRDGSGNLTKRGAAYLAEIQAIVEQLRKQDEELT